MGTKTLFYITVLMLTLSSSAFGQERSKSIDFDDSLVEGVNKKPLDSYSQISDAQKKRKRAHLYRKRDLFDHETGEAFAAMRFTQ